MSSPLLIALSDAVRPEAIAAASAQFELPRHQAGHAMQLGVGAIGAALATKTDDAYVMRRVFDLVARPTTVADPYRAVLSLLFAGRKDAVAHTIARAAGARPELGPSLLHMTAPIALGVLGSLEGPNRSTVVEFTRWLSGERPHLLRATPPQLCPVLGIRASAPLLRHRPSGARPSRFRAPCVLRASTRWLASLVGLGLAFSALRSAARRSCAINPAAGAVSSGLNTDRLARPDAH